MKIDNDTRIPKPLPAPAQADRTGKAKKAGKAYARSAAAPTAPASTDRVEVSDKGRAMQVATAALKQTPQIRADKVAALKAEINDGTYQVPGADIAERMLADDLLG
jgi:negative regulator of flagellin synthesis FlgM